MAALVLVALVATVVVLLYRGDAETAAPLNTAPVVAAAARNPDTSPEAVAAPANPVASEGIQIELYGDASMRLAGVELAGEGRLAEAETWLTNYLKSPSDGRDDQALLALALVYKALGREAEAEDTLRRMVRVRSDSMYAGDGLFELGLMLDEAGRPNEARKMLLEAIRVYRRSRGGRSAARKLADDLYEQHVKTKRKRTEWERIRDYYSIALPNVRDTEERKGVIDRLDELNQWVIFTAYARPAKDYPTNIVFHTVKSRETIGLIAKRYGVTQGSVKRLNGIAPESNIIRPGDELKILRGRTEVHVNLNTFLMTVWINGSFFREYLVGTGREGRTPPGKFKIASRLIDPDWWKGSQVFPPGHPENILGTRWLGFKKQGPGRGIGIHGSQLKDGKWQGIGKGESNGCVRMRNPDVEELFDFVPLGTDVTIIE